MLNQFVIGLGVYACTSVIAYNFNKEVNKMSKCCELLFEMMKYLVRCADDTVWLTDIETVFERLVEIYRKCDGNMSILEKEFPDYPICHESNY